MPQAIDLLGGGLGLGQQLIPQGGFGLRVRNYISSIFAKLQFADRAQAIVAAREAGTGNQPTPRWNTDNNASQLRT